MSKHQPENQIVGQAAAAQPGPPGRRRWARWLVAGVTGVAGLAAASGAAGVTGASGLDDISGSLGNAAKQLIAGGGRITGDDNGGQDPGGKDGEDRKDGKDRKDRKDRKDDGRVVPCDADELIAALVRANAGDGATLTLAERCTYTLTAFAPATTPATPNGPNGLPVITRPIVIKGDGATIVRAANAEPFRILEVGVGGNLTLRDVTIKGGSATVTGGGGIRVDAGGRATLEHTNLVYNQSTGPGGGIANFGVTTITGKANRAEDAADPSKKAHHNEPAARSAEGSAGVAAPTAENAGTGWDRDGKDRDESEISNNVAVFNGGGIHNNGYLTVEDTRVSSNHVRGSGGIVLTGNGGGVSNGRVAVLDGVLVNHNTADFRGGGVQGGLNATTIVKDTEVSDNTASNEGGGIFNDGDFHLEHSTVERNVVGQRGGGIFNQIGQFVVEHSTIRENAVRNEHGGGVYVGSGTVVLRRSHVDQNKAVGANSQAGGIYNNGTVELTGSTVSQNVATLPPGGIFTSNNQVTVDEDSRIIKNRPTNCAGSVQPVPNCFG
ncbi:hypothetical protein [Micromonospora sp. URMC 103]|uniref:hypothetical protein n=1 Tax=Micromonospora sp. URMC 103 TaxID=3423406 RepID=UPI003F1A194E